MALWLGWAPELVDFDLEVLFHCPGRQGAFKRPLRFP
jgi:hypothetical protein